jgi:hypothetical protein
LLDQVTVWAPVLVGLVSATVKAARGTLNFDTLANIFTSCMLVILPAVVSSECRGAASGGIAGCARRSAWRRQTRHCVEAVGVPNHLH